MRGLLLLLALAAALLAAGCGDSGDDSGDGGLRVVATTAVVADLARNVAGDRAEVALLAPAGADPHSYEPRPSDIRRLASADLILRSGGELDEWLGDVADSAAADAPVVTLIDHVERVTAGGEADPHWWHDPDNALLAVAAIREALARADPGGAPGYERRAGAYGDRLGRLDREIATCMRRVPDAQRKLVTTHDALGYFARRYDVEVVGTLLSSSSTQAQPSARDVERLVDRIRAERVEAVFPESALDPRLERAVTREAGVDVGGTLYADGLGPEGSNAGDYAGAMAANAGTMADGMTAGRVRCRAGAG